MKKAAFILGVLTFFLFSCATTQQHIASKDNFKKDHVTKSMVPQLQYYFVANENLVLRRVHLTSRKIEDGIIYKEISDSIFVLKPNTPCVLKYIYRDYSKDTTGVDNFYMGAHEGFKPLPFTANNHYDEFRIRIEGKIRTTSGRTLPAILIRDQQGELQEAWVVVSFDKGNRLAYGVSKKKKTVNVTAQGEILGGKKKKASNEGY